MKREILCDFESYLPGIIIGNKILENTRDTFGKHVFNCRVAQRPIVLDSFISQEIKKSNVMNIDKNDI